MTFKTGNKFGKGGARIGAGRKATPSTQVKQALEELDGDIPTIIEKLKELALKGDREAGIYLINRVYGKPRQEIEQKNLSLTAEIQLTPSDIQDYLKPIMEHERELLENYREDETD